MAAPAPTMTFDFAAGLQSTLTTLSRAPFDALSNMPELAGMVGLDMLKEGFGNLNLGRGAIANFGQSMWNTMFDVGKLNVWNRRLHPM